MPSNNTQIGLKPLGIAVPLWIILMLSLIAGYWLDYSRSLQQYKMLSNDNMELSLQQAKQIINLRLARPERDLRFLSSNLLLTSYLASSHTANNFSSNNSEQYRQQLEQLFSQFMATRLHRYDQLRLLDVNGNEVIRINQGATGVVTVAAEKLQQKSHRYYVQECQKLSAGDVYLSKLDLNVEHGKVELPIKPMWRLCMPVFDSANQRQGMVIINYLAETLLQRLKYMSSALALKFNLLNQDGYWLVASSPEKEWGFMFAERQTVSFAHEFPKAWQQFKNAPHGSVTTMNEHGHFFKVARLDVSTDLHPAQGQYKTGKMGSLYLVSYRSASAKRAYQQKLLTGYQPSFIALTILFAALSYWIGHIAIRRYLIFEELQKTNKELRRLSNIDELTGIANRRYLHEFLQQEISRGSRTRKQLSVILLDVDYFKAYNDTKGHTAGDYCLKKIGEVLRQSVKRSTDLVARYGGEEFCVVLPDTNIENAIEVAEEIRYAVEALAISHPAKIASPVVTVSLGLTALVPTKNTTMKIVFDAADKALYQAKNAGRNRVCV